MRASNIFTDKIISAFVTLTLTSFFLCACGDDKSGSSNPADPVPADSTENTSIPADSTKDAAKDSTKDSTADSLSTEDDITHTISGYINRGQMEIGTTVVLRELDSNLNQTGIVYRGAILDSLGYYSIPDVKLTQPYVHVEALGKFNTVCHEIVRNSGEYFGPVEAYADIRKGDSIDVNLLTLMQATRVTRYMDRGLSFDSAMAASQAEISKLFMLDTLQEDFNKLNMGTSQSDNYYLLGVTVLIEGFYPTSNFENFLERDSWDDGLLGSAWKNAYNVANETDCFKFSENTQKFHYRVARGYARTYLKNIWEAKAKLGECTAANYNEIKSVAYDSTYLMYCDSSMWSYGSCKTLDKITLPAIIDTTPGKVIPGPYCTDTYYYWKDSSWTEADNVSRGLKLACVPQTAGTYGKSGKKCYSCNGNRWKEEDEMEPCDAWLAAVEKEKAKDEE